MRAIGKLDSEDQARTFSDFLHVEGIGNEIDQTGDGAWTIWVHAEDDIDGARQLLDRFARNPRSGEFASAPSAARRLKRREKRATSRTRTRYVDVRTTWTTATVLRPGPLTIAFIGASVAVALLSRLGSNEEVLQFLTIAPHEVIGNRIVWIKGLREIMGGEVWRLVTPIFLHFGLLHLLFNMLWLKDLGSMIESRQGSWYLTALILAIAILSNVGQYYFETNPRFGGMSGVVYGLLGFVWIRGRFDPSSGYSLPRWIVVMMMGWFLLCLIGVIPHIANAAHGVGLLAGAVWGFVSSGRLWK